MEDISRAWPALLRFELRCLAALTAAVTAVLTAALVLLSFSSGVSEEMVARWEGIAVFGAFLGAVPLTASAFEGRGRANGDGLLRRAPVGHVPALGAKLVAIAMGWAVIASMLTVTAATLISLRPTVDGGPLDILLGPAVLAHPAAGVCAIALGAAAVTASVSRSALGGTIAGLAVVPMIGLMVWTLGGGDRALPVSLVLGLEVFFRGAEPVGLIAILAGVALVFRRRGRLGRTVPGRCALLLGALFIACLVPTAARACTVVARGPVPLESARALVADTELSRSGRYAAVLVEEPVPPFRTTWSLWVVDLELRRACPFPGARLERDLRASLGTSACDIIGWSMDDSFIEVGVWSTVVEGRRAAYRFDPSAVSLEGAVLVSDELLHRLR